MKVTRMIETELKSTINAIGLALKSRKSLAIGISSAIAMAFLSVSIPSVITPGNTIGFQLSLLSWENIALTALFSVLFGISMALHSYAMSLKKIRKGMAVGQEAATGVAGMVGGMFSGPLCASCISIIFSVIGLGGSAVIFVLSHRNEILLASVLVIIASIYFAGKKVTRFCENCR